MKIWFNNRQSGIALIMVLVVTAFLGILAAAFAYTMKVETKLARNATFDSEIEWVGRSGINMCRWMLSQEGSGPAGQIDCLNQRWAGGAGNSNSPLATVPNEVQLSDTCSFTWKIVDMDRKININTVSPDILRMILTQSIGLDDQWADTIAASLQDWRDSDNDRTPNGAETEDYATSPNMGFPPYHAKNEDIHDISELLMLKGVTPALFWGAAYGQHWQPPKVRGAASELDEPTFAVGLVDIFTATSSGRVNINTASAQTLEAIFLDPNLVQEMIIKRRAGPDGAEGTEDDMPLRSPAEIAMPGMMGPGMQQPGIQQPGFQPGGRTGVGVVRPFAGAPSPNNQPPPGAMNFANLFDVRSLFFEVQIDARAGDRTRKYIAVLRRFGQRDIRVMNMYWK